MPDEHLPMNEKRTQRRLGIERRRALTPEQRARASELLCARLAGLSAFRSARRVFTYAARAEEADPAALCALAPEKEWYYPLCLSGREMAALRPLSPDAWQRGAFGIPEPVPERSGRCPPEALELVLVPLTAFDDQCGRVGMGGGYYDRFLPRCGRAVCVGVAFACQQVERVAAESWDWPLDAVVTERETFIAPGGRIKL